MGLLFNMTMGIEVWGAVFTLMIFIVVCMEKNKPRQRYLFAAMQMTCFIYIISDILSWSSEGKGGEFYVIISRISTFIFYICGYFLLLLFIIQVFYGLEKTRGLRLFQWTIYIALVLEIVIVIISQFNPLLYYYDVENNYHRSYGYLFSQFIAAAIVGAMVCYVLINFNRFNDYRRISLVVYSVIPLAGIFLQTLMYGASFICISLVFSNIVTFFVTRRELEMENLKSHQEMMSQREKLFAQEKEIHDMNYRIVMSQIKPHFLYNALNAIYYLCESDSAKAQKAIEDFSEYLRGNMNFIQSDKAIPFEEELQHIKHYLSLEKVRFEDDLEIIYDIQEKDFKVPALCVQPIVENAVKHGLGKKAGGGFVRLTSDRIDGHYRIVVSDNGIGFKLDQYRNDGELHIGLENVRTRLRQMMEGEIIIDSKPGMGTEVTILIPEKGNELL